jgi:hypothetical protein
MAPGAYLSGTPHEALANMLDLAKKACQEKALASFLGKYGPSSLPQNNNPNMLD